MKDNYRWHGLNNPYTYRDDNLRAMGFQSYGEYLRSDLWASIRAKVLAVQPDCVKCAKKVATQVHHRSYDPATMRGDTLASLSALCRRCHWLAERPKDHGQSRYERFKSAGEFMFRRGHPTVRGRHLKRKAANDGIVVRKSKYGKRRRRKPLGPICVTTITEPRLVPKK